MLMMSFLSFSLYPFSYSVVGDKRLHALKRLFKGYGVKYTTLSEDPSLRQDLLNAYILFLTAASLSSGGTPRPEDWYNLRRDSFSIGSNNVLDFKLFVSKRKSVIDYTVLSLSSPMTTLAMAFMFFGGWPTDTYLQGVDITDRLTDSMRRYAVLIFEREVCACCVDTSERKVYMSERYAKLVCKDDSLRQLFMHSAQKGMFFRVED